MLNKNYKKIIIILALCLLTVILIVGGHYNSHIDAVHQSDINQHLTIKELNKKLKNKDTFSILIYEHTCPPCKKEIKELKKAKVDSQIYLLDLENSQNSSQYTDFKKLNIEYTPTILKIYKGQVVKRQEGFINSKLISKMKLNDWKIHKNTVTKIFKPINLKKFRTLIKHNKNFIVYIGRPTCPDCRSFENDFLKLNLNKINSSKIDLFYLNVNSIHTNKLLWKSFKKENKIYGTPAFVHYHNNSLVSSSSWTIKDGYNTKEAYTWLLRQSGNN